VKGGEIMNRKNHFVGLVLTVLWLPLIVAPQRWDTRREIVEGRHEVNQERREARREIRNADSPMERRHEIREGARELSRERREAERQIRRSTW
jgi:hypothetical protein